MFDSISRLLTEISMIAFDVHLVLLYDEMQISYWSFTDAVKNNIISTDGTDHSPSHTIGYKKKSSTPMQSTSSNQKTHVPPSAAPQAQVTHLPDKQKDRQAGCTLGYNDKYDNSMDVSFRNNCKWTPRFSLSLFISFCCFFFLDKKKSNTESPLHSFYK